MGIDDIKYLKPTGFPETKTFNENDPANMTNEKLLEEIDNYEGEIWREDWFIALKVEAARRRLI